MKILPRILPIGPAVNRDKTPLRRDFFRLFSRNPRKTAQPAAFWGIMIVLGRGGKKASGKGGSFERSFEIVERNSSSEF
jgi:hypothetical protein